MFHILSCFLEKTEPEETTLKIRAKLKNTQNVKYS